jgi:hypothetical protein
LGAQSAGASSTTHKFKAKGNNSTLGAGSGLAIETKAKASITCNSATGSYNVTVKNVSVIGQDGTTFTTSGGRYEIAFEDLGGEIISVDLTQNPKTELFDANASGVLANRAAECKTGLKVALLGSDSGDHAVAYVAIGTLS